MQPLRWWAKSAPPGGDMVKAFENLGVTSVAPVAPVDTSLCSVMQSENSFSQDLICPFICCKKIWVCPISLIDFFFPPNIDVMRGESYLHC